jgi:acylphosphatase
MGMKYAAGKERVALEANKRLDAVVRGRVQGVGFRQSTEAQAHMLGLTGWVANRRDGAVSVVAEGSKPVLERFLKWLQNGPAMAHVDDVDIYWTEATGEFRSFSVRG